MVLGTAHSDRFGQPWAAVTALVAAEGAAHEPFATALLSPAASMRDLADAVHCLCLLHGRHPGIVEFAESRATDPVAAAWLGEVVEAFAGERASLVRLVAAVGPLPSTPGQAETESAIAGQRHALDMLAGSDRAGCPIGAAMALMLDWPVIRAVLDSVAERIGVDLPVGALPQHRDSATVIATLAETVAFERAMLFGAQQLLAQHHALWQLLEARSVARATL
ncbi:MAG: hypothetical protein V4537_10385 [Pseudomonadota bacterium]